MTNLAQGEHVEYKSPPEEWMNPIPKHWKSEKGRYYIKERNERTETGDETHLSLSKDIGLVPHDEISDDEHRADSLEGYKICEKGDLVMNKMQAWNGAFGVASQRGIVSPDYTVLHVNTECDPEYLKFLYKTPMYVAQFKWRSSGIGEAYLRLHTRELEDIPIYLPPYDAQQQILDYIKTELTRMANIREGMSQLSSLVSERVYSIINNRVIKGGGSSTIKKQSKTSWLDEIPSHWKESKLKYVSDDIIDSVHDTAPVKRGGDYHIIRTSDVRAGELKLDQTQMTTESVYQKWTKRGKPEKGDLILTREAPAGEVGIVPDKTNLLLGQRTVLIKPDESKVLPRYLLYALRSDLFGTHININSRGSTVSHINYQDLKETPILIPPMGEQMSVMEHIRKQEILCEKVDMNSLKMRKYLGERKDSLLTAAITGQIDVTEDQSDDQEVLQ